MISGLRPRLTRLRMGLMLHFESTGALMSSLVNLIACNMLMAPIVA